MSRRYRIEITAPTGETPSVAPDPNAFGAKKPSSNQLPTVFQNFFPLDVLSDGKNVNTAYLDVELDLSTNGASTQNQGAQLITIRGVTPQMVAQVHTLNNYDIVVYGGFAKGMPLATSMASLGFTPLVKGKVFGAFGNWVGTDIYISLPILPTNGVGVVDGNGTVQFPNMTLNGKKGEQWEAVITRSLVQAMPNVKYVVDVRKELVLSEDQQGTGYNLDAMGQLWNKQSMSILGSDPTYQGIGVSWRSGTLYVTDNPKSVGSKDVTIKASQLIGNPVWTQPLTLQLMCPMRSDIYIGDTVTIPQDALYLAPSTAATAQADVANATSAASLSGSYAVNGIRHLGRSRSPEAAEWSSIYDLTYLVGTAASQAPVTDGSQPFGQKP